MKMPFGKYKDKNLEDIPIDYLRWANDKITFRDERLKERIEYILFLDEYEPEPPPIPTKFYKVIMPEDVSGIYRELSKKWHPDIGGTKEAMQALNDFYDALKNNIIEIETR